MIWIELLESTAVDALDDEARQQLANVRASAVKMTELISAQIESSTDAVAASDRVEIASVVRDAISDVATDLDAVGAKVRVGTLPVVRGDARQLYQLFRNLLENAIKYRRDDVTSEIAIDSRVASGSAGPDGCEILVEDNGRGFAPEDAERIFEPSERLASNGADGQGLGLAICKSIVERHGGRLCAEGRPDEGATFRIVLPSDRIYK
jgi:signal transduction histidine kinase